MKTKSPLIVLAAVSLLLSVQSIAAEDKLPGHAGHEEHAAHMLTGYIGVADALYKDDLVAAKRAAAELAVRDEEGSLSEPALAIAKATDMAGAREAFKILSARAAALAKGHAIESYVLMLCPMVEGGNGIWLSPDGKVNNPYFGARMPHCGAPKE